MSATSDPSSSLAPPVTACGQVDLPSGLLLVCDASALPAELLETLTTPGPNGLAPLGAIVRTPGETARVMLDGFTADGDAYLAITADDDRGAWLPLDGASLAARWDGVCACCRVADDLDDLAPAHSRSGAS
ncbi:hypothetical protein F8280_26790 [Micromonospora noduli]|uniref:hypothetical protein n=1 Tax=Micromonospora noduli TaxID=709876 RepID=UPI00124B965F|nr:hypothetical protein [Micromonospora noduli]KAB1919092.1 hypothetical protein F8280_26790 [Micromonospora noduli]